MGTVWNAWVLEFGFFRIICGLITLLILESVKEVNIVHLATAINFHTMSIPRDERQNVPFLSHYPSRSYCHYVIGWSTVRLQKRLIGCFLLVIPSAGWSVESTSGRSMGSCDSVRYVWSRHVTQCGQSWTSLVKNLWQQRWGKPMADTHDGHPRYGKWHPSVCQWYTQIHLTQSVYLRMTCVFTVLESHHLSGTVTHMWDSVLQSCRKWDQL